MLRLSRRCLVLGLALAALLGPPRRLCRLTFDTGKLSPGDHVRAADATISMVLLFSKYL